MSRKAGMIHGVADNARFFGRIAAEVTPDIELVHFVDGGIPSMSANEFRPRVIERLRTLAAFALESEAEAVLITCTAFGRLVDEVQPAVSIPVLSVLEIMVQQALHLNGTLGLLGSHPGTMATAARMLEEEAAMQGRKLDLRTQYCHGAFDAVARDDWATHNRIVLTYLRQLLRQVDAIVAPQPSIERVMPELDEAERSRVLTSPRISALQLRQTLMPAA